MARGTGSRERDPEDVVFQGYKWIGENKRELGGSGLSEEFSKLFENAIGLGDRRREEGREKAAYNW